MNSKLAAAALVLLGALGALELLGSAFVYRDQIDASDWDAAAQALEELPEDAPVILAQPWLGPTGRMSIPVLRTPMSVALPDLRGHGRIHTIGYEDTGARRLDELWDGGTRPTLVGTRETGSLIVATWDFEPERTLWDWTRQSPERMDAGGPCRGAETRKCPRGRVRLRFGEVDYEPRWAWWADLEDGATLRFADRVVLGNTLRGHIGFSDFNARLRSDAPVRVVVRVNEVTHKTFVVSDEEGWRSFEIATTPGAAEVEVELSTTLRRVWNERGYGMPPNRSVGLELRALEAAP